MMAILRITQTNFLCIKGCLASKGRQIKVALPSQSKYPPFAQHCALLDHRCTLLVPFTDVWYNCALQDAQC